MTTETPSNDLGAIRRAIPFCWSHKADRQPTGGYSAGFEYGLHGDRIRIAWAADHGEAPEPSLGADEPVLVLCREAFPVNDKRVMVAQCVDTGVHIDASTWPRDGLPGAAPQRMWLGVATLWHHQGLWAARARTPSGRMVGVGNQPDRNAALRALEEVISKAETNA